jgi:hypothetical protein
MDEIKDGGGFVGKGRYGCVFSPSLSCQDNRRIDRETISKLISRENEKNEMRNLEKIRSIDPAEEFSINNVKTCVPASKQKQIFDECHISRADVAQKPEKFLLLLQKYGGISIKRWLNIKNAPKPSIINIVGNMYNLLRGINVLRVNGLVHYDIRTTNIVIDSMGVMRLIDFGKSRMTTEITPLTINSKPYHPHPFDLKLYAKANLEGLEDIDAFREMFRKTREDYDIIEGFLRPGLFTESRIWAGVKQLETLTREVAMNFVCSKLDLYSLGLVFAEIMTKFYGRKNKDPKVRHLFDIIDGMTDPNVVLRNTIMETYTLLVGYMKHWRIDISNIPIEKIPKMGEIIADEISTFENESETSVTDSSKFIIEELSREDDRMQSTLASTVKSVSSKKKDLIDDMNRLIDIRRPDYVVTNVKSMKKKPKKETSENTIPVIESSSSHTGVDIEQINRKNTIYFYPNKDDDKSGATSPKIKRDKGASMGVTPKIKKIKSSESDRDSESDMGSESESEMGDIIYGKLDEDKTKCPKDQQYNMYSKRCCDRGEVVNHKTHRCIKLANLIDSVNKSPDPDPKCSDGKMVNPYTHRCIDIKRYELMMKKRDAEYKKIGDQSCDITAKLRGDYGESSHESEYEYTYETVYDDLDELDDSPAYNPPKPTYNPPKPAYNPPKSVHNPQKPVHNPPKPINNPPKPVHNPPKPVHNPPKPVHNPPNISPKRNKSESESSEVLIESSPKINIKPGKLLIDSSSSSKSKSKVIPKRPSPKKLDDSEEFDYGAISTDSEAEKEYQKNRRKDNVMKPNSKDNSPFDLQKEAAKILARQMELLADNSELQNSN